ncbi:MAG: hypothetical protein ACI8RA_003123 [Chlamydiales bacterium]|jgi:hypothetical protein
MNRFFLSIFLATLSLLIPVQQHVDAGETSPMMPTPEAPSFPMDNVPRTIVNGSVNVVTGDYCENAVDLILDGPEPITINRTHSSSLQTGNLNWGWNSSHDCRLLFFDMDHSDGGHHSTKWKKAYSQEPSGSGVFFLSEGKAMKRAYKLDIGKHGKGLTNCGSGEISAKTNMKNINLKVIANQNEAFEMLFGDGAKRIYKRCEEIKYYRQNEVPINEYLLCSVNFPSGNNISYQYGGRRELFKMTVGKGGKLFREVVYSNNSHDPSKGKYTAPTAVYSADNGKKIEYYFAADPQGQKFNPLEKVVSSDKPDTFYTYHLNKALASYGKIHGRTLGNKREGNEKNESYLETEYYCYGKIM